MATIDGVAKPIREIDQATVRFCGDSGDGMQLAGTQFTNTSALAGNDVATFPDFPAEIRAPRGTLAGVSGFQIHFASRDIFTPGDQVDALVAMNPAALATNLCDLVRGGILIVNEDAFEDKGLKQAGYATSPLDDGSLAAYQVFPVPMTRQTRLAVAELNLGMKESDRCRNFYAMGLVFWLYDRSLEPTLRYIEAKFGKKPEIAEANRRALRAGYNYGETVEAFASHFRVQKAELPPGVYRNIMGNEALAYGLIAASQLSGCDLFLGSYPITPASDILHELSRHKNFGVRTFQAEDEIAAITSAIGASFGGAMAVTSSSGPGIALKQEAMGLAVMTELPLIVINVQRGGPSTGLPTKTEQADLLQAMFGRNGECPIPVIAARSPADCFDVAIEAWRIATRFMTPVILLSDGYIANGSEPWRLPNIDELPRIEVTHPQPAEDGAVFHPYERNERLARPWALPGTPKLMHRIGGLEKQDITGNVNYEPENHQHMVNLRARKIAGIADDIPLQTVDGPEGDTDRGRLLVLSWGGTYGACATAVREVRAAGHAVAHCHLRYMNPLPRNLGEILRRYDRVLVPELNRGQLRLLVRGEYLVDCVGLNKIKGKPFSVAEVTQKIYELLDEPPSAISDQQLVNNYTLIEPQTLAPNP
ncbi:MAG TPA: 2-oxoacid:acceptor oxidoreductase subunit alpha [Pirellulales bacterium]|nr:2-oxoacid:acceptor oxidoreductase subunit alpha [Pirellulales bacterium]